MTATLTESEQQSGTVECGEEAAKHFALASGYRNLNHGSYGTYPLAVRSVFRDFQERIEARPDAFVRYEYRTRLLGESRRAIAGYLGVPDDTCVFTPNATTGIDTVLRNLIYEPGDVVICFALLYESFGFTLQYLRETTLVEVCKVEYTLPVSDSAICDAFENVVNDLKAQKKNPRVAIFDTINSVPGVRMPFERLTKLCKAHHVLSCIDGAHGVGHIPLHLRELDPDFFVSNCHKWLYAPRGCAVLYVPSRNQHLMRITLPTGFHFTPLARKDEMNFISNFSDTGTMDNTPFLCVPAALAWRRRLTWRDKKGEDAAMSYMSTLARDGGRVVAAILETEVLENDEGTLGACNFANIRLPLPLNALTSGDPAKIRELAQWVMRIMIIENHTSVMVISHGETLWARLSAQVYLTLLDFTYAGQKLKETCEMALKGEWIS